MTTDAIRNTPISLDDVRRRATEGARRLAERGIFERDVEARLEWKRHEVSTQASRKRFSEAGDSTAGYVPTGSRVYTPRSSSSGLANNKRRNVTRSSWKTRSLS